MKTSNIIILSAFIIIVAGVFVNAFQLRDMYVDRSNSQRNSINKYIPDEQMIYIETRYNPKIRSEARAEINITQGEPDMFAASDTSQFELMPVDSGLIVRVKNRQKKAYIMLSELSKLRVSGRTNVTISGFTRDSMRLCSDSDASVTVENCHIDKLSVQNIGGKTSIAGGNTIKHIDIRLRGGNFTSGDAPYESATCDADAKSHVNLTGRSIGMFK